MFERLHDADRIRVTTVDIFQNEAAFVIDGRAAVSLDNAPALRKVLGVLALAQGATVDAQTLLEALYPASKASRRSMAHRLYSLVHRLRALGFGELIETTGQGWRFAQHVHIHHCTTTLRPPARALHAFKK